jgi:hypothetical protein
VPNEILTVIRTLLADQAWASGALLDAGLSALLLSQDERERLVFSGTAPCDATGVAIAYI